MNLRETIARNKTNSLPLPNNESTRVLNLPVIAEKDRKEYPVESLRLTPGVGDLKAIQCQALSVIVEQGGGLFPIGVGWGKTLIALLAGTVSKAEYVVILAPSQTLENLEAEYERFKTVFRIPANVTMLAYEILSRETGEAKLIASLGPRGSKAIVICDEAHKLKRKEAARTGRVLRIAKEWPNVKWVFLSGTITSKSLRDFEHLSRMALGEGSPVPHDRAHFAAWAECIDVAGQPGPMQWSYVMDLWRTFGEGKKYGRFDPKQLFQAISVANRREQVRDAFKARLYSAPGVIGTTDGSIGTSLIITAIGPKDLPVPAIVADAIKAASNEGLRPDGAIIADPAKVSALLKQLSAGFYYRWAWPEGKIDHAWMEARQEWNRHLRAELIYRARAGYDSPLLVIRQLKSEIEQGVGNRAIHAAWLDWAAQKDKSKPPTVAVWLSTYLVDAAVAWLGGSDDAAMLWFESQEIGKALDKRGVRVYAAGNSPVPTRATRAHKMAASIQAHGLGKNMPQWQSALVIEPPSGGLVWQQMLGRLHRPESPFDEIEFSVMMHTWPFRRAVKSAKADANYAEIGGEVQRLNIATWVGLKGQPKGE